MKRISGLISILQLCISLAGYSQMKNDYTDTFINDFEADNIFREKKEVKYSGSPYLNDDFKDGTIKFSDGKEYRHIFLRYNTYRDQFEFSREDKDYVLVKSPLIPEVRIEDKVFVFRDYECKDEYARGYLEQLVDGEYSLYLKHNTLLRAVEDIGAFSEASDPKFWPQKPLVLIGNTEDGIIEIKGSKDLLNEFQGIRESIANYTGKKKLRLKSREDYIELVTYLNTRSSSSL